MATVIDKHLFGMLKEIDSICKANGISYYLSNHSAWDAVKFGGYHEGMYLTSIMMLEDDLACFQKQVLPENRKLIPFPHRGSVLKYADMNSVLLNYADYFQDELPAIGVEISVARRQNDIIEITDPSGKQHEVQPEFFDNPTFLPFEGLPFPVFSDYSHYFDLLVGENWREKSYPWKVPRKKVECIYIKDFSPAIFLDLPFVKKSLMPERFSKRMEYWQWEKEVYKPAKKKISRYHLLLKRTQDRFGLWETFYPKKKKLLALAEQEGSKEVLIDELEPLLEKTWWYKQKGLGFSIDNDILSIALPILEERYGSEAVEDYINLIPPEYLLQDIAEILRARGVKHPCIEGT